MHCQNNTFPSDTVGNHELRYDNFNSDDFCPCNDATTDFNDFDCVNVILTIVTLTLIMTLIIIYILTVTLITTRLMNFINFFLKLTQRIKRHLANCRLIFAQLIKNLKILND